MTSSDDNPNPATLQEELVAYLDGELDTASEQELEHRLAVDAEAREELHRLERAWSALDHLPRAEVDGTFTQSTIEMVAYHAEEEVQLIEKTSAWRRRVGVLLGIACLLLAGMGGYWMVQRLAPDPNEQLVRDLPVLENLDQYTQVDSVEFLRMLKESGLFEEPENEP
jgi:anti-sigma factor RsiW